ncbi:MAG: LTA synthase family protein [Chitinophagaceae bacterium]|nr:LTA synthase family protein [Chitinophagaceae bacterium]
MNTFLKNFTIASEWRYAISLFKKLYLLLIIYSLMRVWFYIANNDIANNYYFKSDNGVFPLFLNGLHTDVVVIFFINAPIVLLHLLPFSIRDNRIYIGLTNILFCIINLPFLFISIVDIYFFSFSLERSSAAVISFSKDFFPMFFTYLNTYWLAAVLLLLIVALLYYYSVKAVYRISGNSTPVTQGIIFVVAGAVWTFSVSEMWRLPNTNFHPVATNSPYTVVKSAFSDAVFFNNIPLRKKTFFAPRDLKKQFNPDRYYFQKGRSPQKMNVFLIVLESFSKQYVGVQPDGISYSPFLDSLGKHSLQFTNAFANARHSNEGIPSIISSLPSLMKESIILSQYKNNRVPGLGTMLKKQGYSSAFFHGGINGVYGFDFFTQKAGFDHYYGKNEYADSKDFDGAWGIWDDKFFQYSADVINTMKTPFVASLFSVSSHHPFHIPEYFTDYPPVLNHHPPMAKCIYYSDYSLKLFFDKIKMMPWYSNTLFVITADHSANTNDHSPFYNTRLGAYRIPLLFYIPDRRLTGVSTKVVQQIDILPSIIDYLNFNEKFRSFGKSVFDTSGQRYTYQLFNNVYQIADSAYMLTFDGKQIVSLFNHRTDSLLRTNLNKSILSPEVIRHQNQLLNNLKAVVQTYNYSMNHDALIE